MKASALRMEISLSDLDQVIKDTGKALSKRATDLVASDPQLAAPGQPTAALLAQIGDLPLSTDLPTLLKPFATTTDDLIQTVVGQVRPRGRLVRVKHDPGLYEHQLSEVARLLNRCDKLKQDADVCASKAIESSYGFLYREASRANRRLSLLVNNDAAAKQRSVGYADAATDFGDEEALARGYGKAFSTDSSYIYKISEADKTKNSLQLDAIDLEEKHDRTMKAEFEAAGSPLNPVEQYDRLTKLLTAEFQEAYERLLAVELARLEGINDINRELEAKALPSDGPDLFTSICLWVRSALSRLSWAAEREQEFLVPVVIGGEEKSSYTLLDEQENELNADVVRPLLRKGNNTPIKFKLRPNAFIPGYYSVRLYSMGFAFILSEGYAQTPQYQKAWYRAELTIPSKKYEQDGLTWDQKPRTVAFGSIGALSAESSFEERGGPSFESADFQGVWELDLYSKGISAIGQFQRDDEQLRGFVVYVRVVGRRAWE